MNRCSFESNVFNAQHVFYICTRRKPNESETNDHCVASGNDNLILALYVLTESVIFIYHFNESDSIDANAFAKLLYKIDNSRRTKAYRLYFIRISKIRARDYSKPSRFASTLFW